VAAAPDVRVRVSARVDADRHLCDSAGAAVAERTGAEVRRLVGVVNRGWVARVGRPHQSKLSRSEAEIWAPRICSSSRSAENAAATTGDRRAGWCRPRLGAREAARPGPPSCFETAAQGRGLLSMRAGDALRPAAEKAPPAYAIALPPCRRAAGRVRQVDAQKGASGRSTRRRARQGGRRAKRGGWRVGDHVEGLSPHP
jgi:hypothetical protein